MLDTGDPHMPRLFVGREMIETKNAKGVPIAPEITVLDIDWV
jgi:hypothetical protein